MEIKFLYRKRISYFMELLYITLSRCHAPKSEVHAFGLFFASGLQLPISSC